MASACSPPPAHATIRDWGLLRRKLRRRDSTAAPKLIRPSERRARDELVLGLLTHNARGLPKDSSSIRDWPRHSRHKHHAVQALAVLLQETFRRNM